MQLHLTTVYIKYRYSSLYPYGIDTEYNIIFDTYLKYFTNEKKRDGETAIGIKINRNAV